MASSSKEKAVWSSEDVETFCRLCVEEIEKGNRPSNNKRDGWTVIINKFEEQRHKKYDKNKMKSKWDNLKDEWRRWRSLTLKETGVGWDPMKNTIDATEEWWEKKIQENPKFRAFKTKGIKPSLQALMDKMFGDTVATGSVTWTLGRGLCVDKDDVATQLDIEDCAGSTDENIECSVGEKTVDHAQSKKRASQSSVRHAPNKKQKKLSTSAELSSQMERIVLAFETRSNAPTVVREFDPYKEIMDALDGIPEIMQDGELYFFALEHFAEKKDFRQIFMNLRDNEKKVQWIKRRFEKHTSK
ncbi:L10-interacting MYB domain-containing protein-like [Rhodamnia argentea]|uniref:L10-interacting MYB domain-containing protein-like n=1 Tax=Rhodamnia argentea TaxID=178133 RepID=A0A8B8NFI8_9MYRT|nr:L10-interacting MYB domain-containing protein-like [Rhodamnia argentea]